MSNISLASDPKIGPYPFQGEERKQFPNIGNIKNPLPRSRRGLYYGEYLFGSPEDFLSGSEVFTPKVPGGNEAKGSH